MTIKPTYKQVICKDDDWVDPGTPNCIPLKDNLYTAIFIVTNNGKSYYILKGFPPDEVWNTSAFLDIGAPVITFTANEIVVPVTEHAPVA